MALTKVTGQVVNTSTDLTVGVLTATTVSVGGTLTYEDVTNVDSVGLITARNGIEVTDKGVQVGTGATVDSAAANTLTFLTGGSERARFDSNGNFGINNTSPSSYLAGSRNLVIGAGSGAAGLTVRSSTSTDGFFAFADGTTGNETYRGYIAYGHSTDSLRFATSATERLRITSAGRIGIGTDDPQQNVQIDSSTETTLSLYEGGQKFGALQAQGSSNFGTILYSYNGNPLVFSTNSGTGFTRALTIDTSQRVLIGTTTEGKEEADNLTIADSGDCGLTIRSGTSNYGAIYFSDATSGAGEYDGFFDYHHGSRYFRFGTAQAERMRIDSSGRLLLGLTSGRAVGGGTQSLAQIETTSQNGLSFVAHRGTNTSGSILVLGKSRGTSVGSNTIVANGDELGALRFAGADGTDVQSRAASIAAYVDGTPGSNDMPGSLRFSTTADGASTPTERMRIDSSGRLLLGTTTTASVAFTVYSTSNSSIQFQNSSTGTATADGFYLGNSTGTTAYVWNYENAPLTFATNNAERMRIDSSGRLLVGTISSKESLSMIQCVRSDNSTLSIFTSDVSASGQAKINLGPSNNITGAQIICDAEEDFSTGANRTGRLSFTTRLNGTIAEAMRITSNGDIRVAMANFDNSSVDGNSVNDGVVIDKSGDIKLQVARSNGTPMAVNRIGNDGNVINIRQAGTLEGSISVSSNTVSYNGGHLSRWSQLVGISTNIKSDRPTILRGSVLSNLDEMCEWGDENNEQLNRMKVSDVEGDINVAGVFQDWDDDDDTYTNDFYCAMTGDFVIRIASGVTVQRGNLLMSAGDGTAKPQGDGYIQDKTIAKVTSTTVSTTYSDGSYCVPCVLMAC